MKIGITERGDAGIDMRWASKMDTVDGAVLITKHITDEFIYRVMRCNKPIIIHCTCTGYGGSQLEPNVPIPEKQILKCMEFIDKGFPASYIALRIDPIFPSPKGLKKLDDVLSLYSRTLYYKGVTRIRISIVDEYKHVKDRYAQQGWPSLYGNNFQASTQQLQETVSLLNMYGYKYECCAEKELASMSDKITERGCISPYDLFLMNLSNDTMIENSQNRQGCHCLSCKTELLENKHPCKHGCVYCYWR